MSATGSRSKAFFREARTIALGTASARGIALLTLPFVTRLYGPEDFAILSVFVAVLTICAPLVSLRYSAAIPVARSSVAAVNIAAGALLVLTTSLFLVMAALFSSFRLELAPEGLLILDPYLWLVPLALIAISLWDLLSFWSTRNRRFKIAAKAIIVQSFGSVVARLGLGVLGFAPAGLLIGQLLSRGGGVGVLFRAQKADFYNLAPWVSFSRIRRVLWVHRMFPVFLMPSVFLNALALQLPTLYLASRFDANTLGQFGLAWAVLFLPVQLLAKPFSRVFYAHSAELGKQKTSDISALLYKVIWPIASIIFPANAALYFLAPTIFPLVFGDRWQLSGDLSSNISICLSPLFLFASLNIVLNVLGKQSLRLLFEIQNIILSIILFFWCSFQELDVFATTWLYGLIMCGHYTICIAITFRSLQLGTVSGEKEGG